MRLLHVVPTYLPATRYGGPIYSVHGLCAALARRGLDVHVFTTNVDGRGVSDVPLGEEVNLDGVTVTYFPTGLGRRLYRSPAMYAALNRNLASFDIAHLHSVFLWPTTATAAMARRLGLPYVLSPRGMLVPELIRRRSWLIKRMWIDLFECRNLAQAAAVHVTADIEAAEIRRLGFKVQRFAVVPNGVEVPLVVGARHDTPDNSIAKPTILFLGRINWKKGLDRLISALALLPGAQLVIAGNDEENYSPQLVALAIKHGVLERTHFVGPLHGAAKWKAFAAADVFALPSYSENFGIAVLEAMASGLPVVVTPEVGLASAIVEKGAGVLVDGTPEKIAVAIDQLIASPELRHRMGEAGRKAAVDRFSWDKIAEQMEELYLTLIMADPSGPASKLSIQAR